MPWEEKLDEISWVTWGQGGSKGKGKGHENTREKMVKLGRVRVEETL